MRIFYCLFTSRDDRRLPLCNNDWKGIMKIECKYKWHSIYEVRYDQHHRSVGRKSAPLIFNGAEYKENRTILVDKLETLMSEQFEDVKRIGSICFWMTRKWRSLLLKFRNETRWKKIEVHIRWKRVESLNKLLVHNMLAHDAAFAFSHAKSWPYTWRVATCRGGGSWNSAVFFFQIFLRMNWTNFCHDGFGQSLDAKWINEAEAEE